MKLVFLNVWWGKVENSLAKFIKEQAHDTDIFCLQEVSGEAQALCRATIPDYEEIVAHKGIIKDNHFFQVIYVNKKSKLLSSGTLFENQDDSGLAIYIEIQFAGHNLYILNFHGTWRPLNKLDSPEKIRQSEELIGLFEDKKGQKIIGGDFNLFPETESIRLFEGSNYRNLIKDFHIPTTRNRLGWDRFPPPKYEKQLYSDYVFVSPDVKVKNFSVPDIEVSDHLPMILEIEL